MDLAQRGDNVEQPTSEQHWQKVALPDEPLPFEHADDDAAAIPRNFANGYGRDDLDVGIHLVILSKPWESHSDGVVEEYPTRSATMPAAKKLVDLNVAHNLGVERPQPNRQIVGDDSCSRGQAVPQVRHRRRRNTRESPVPPPVVAKQVRRAPTPSDRRISIG